MGSRKPKYSHAKTHPPTTLLNPRKCICPNCKMYFFQIARYIWPKYQIYLFKLQNVFVQGNGISQAKVITCKNPPTHNSFEPLYTHKCIHLLDWLWNPSWTSGHIIHIWQRKAHCNLSFWQTLKIGVCIWQKHTMFYILPFGICPQYSHHMSTRPSSIDVGLAFPISCATVILTLSLVISIVYFTLQGLTRVWHLF